MSRGTGADCMIVRLANRINAQLVDEKVDRCAFAASAPIHKQLLEALDPEARAKIGQVLASNLTKTDPNELLGHFQKATEQRNQTP